MIKLLNDTQGTILLVEHGLASQARVVLRAALETLFVLGNVCFDEHFSRSFLAASERKRLKHLRAIHNNPSVVFDAVRPTITPELLDELAQEIEDTGVTEKSAEALARRAGVAYLYDGAYRLFSQDVHASPQALEQYLILDETREIRGLAWGPETKEVQAELTVAPRVMILGFLAINQLFHLHLDAELQSLDEALRHLENPPGATTETQTPFPTTHTKERSMSQTLLEMAKDLVLAQIQAHKLSPDEMHTVLQQTYASLLALKTQEEGNGSVAVATPETPPEPVHWRKSITKHTVTCLECGASFKQLSVRHLREHGLDGRSYRVKYGIPRTQSLAAKEMTSRRKEIVQRSRPWEKAPTFLKAQEEKKREQAPVAQKKRTVRAKA